ncbi:MAG: hypothetical protein QMD92_00660 [bacterium]|nr:hypothetical protein [bacterium]
MDPLNKKLLLINTQEQITNSILQCTKSEYSYIEISPEDKKKIIKYLKNNDFFSIFINPNPLKYNIQKLIVSIKDLQSIPIIIMVEKDDSKSFFDSIYQDTYLFIEKPLNHIILAMVIKNTYEIYRLKKEASILFQNLIESNKKIEEGNKHLKEIEDKIEQLLSLRYA